MAADLFETYAVTAVAVMLLGTAFPAGGLPLFPLAIGGVSIIASVIGIWFARVGRGGSIMNALYKAVAVATVLSAIGFIPVTMAFDEGAFTFGELYVAALIGLVITFAPRGDHRVLHGHALGPGQVDRRARRRPATRRTSSRGSPSACRRPRSR